MKNRFLRVESILKGLSYGIVATGILSVGGYTGISYTGGCVLLFLAGLYGDFRTARFPPRIFLNILALAAMIFAIVRVRTDDVVIPVIELLMLLTVVKLLEEKKVRDYLQIFGLSVFLLAGSALLSLDMIFLLYLVVYIFLMGAGAILLSYYAESPDLVLEGRVIMKLVSHGLILPLVVLPLTTVLFFLLPRTGHPLFETFQRKGIGTSGFSDHVGLGEVSAIQEDNTVVFRVRTKPLTEEKLYWRGIVLDHFDGKSWHSFQKAQKSPSFPPALQGQRISYTLYLEPHGMDSLFTADKPVNLILRGAVRGPGLTYKTSRPLNRRLRYEGVSVLSEFLPEEEIDRAVWLQLPGDLPQIRTLVTELIRGADQQEAVQRIYRFLKVGSYRYSLRDLPVSPHPLEDFLLKRRYGNCEYFASAMAVMLRTAGIPARLVGGYRSGYYSQTGGYYIVLQKNAHVWVEAYLNEKEWVRFDPTPPYQESGSVNEAGFFFRMGMTLDFLRYYWNMAVIGYDMQRQFHLFETLQTGLKNLDLFKWPAIRDPVKTGWSNRLTFLTLAGLILVIMGYALLRRNRPREDVLISQFLARMKKLGYLRGPSQGLLEFVREVSDEELRKKAGCFVNAFHRRYYRDRRFSRRDAVLLRRLIREIRKSPGN